MKRLLSTLIVLTLATLVKAQVPTYEPDILGEEFEQFTIVHPAAYDGDVVSTLVRLRAPHDAPRRAVLYVHGYNDYFFQEEMATLFAQNGWQFYALDLRRYGRSLREWQRPYDLRNIEEYFDDIDSALDMMELEGLDEIVLMAHSTGGLTTSLYCHHNRNALRVSALLLNSPFFDMNLGWTLETLGQPIVSAIGAWFRDWEMTKSLDVVSGYSKSLLKEWDGEWEFDTKLKSATSIPITAGWFRAISQAQSKLQRGLDIPCPVLVMFSDRSVWGAYSAEYLVADSVLDVDDIAFYAERIGSNVTKHQVEGGLHDLILSRPEVRYPLYEYIFGWLDNSL